MLFRGFYTGLVTICYSGLIIRIAIRGILYYNNTSWDVDRFRHLHHHSLLADLLKDPNSVEATLKTPSP